MQRLTFCAAVLWVVTGVAGVHSPAPAGIVAADPHDLEFHETHPAPPFAGQKESQTLDRSFRVAQNKKGRKGGNCRKRCGKSVSGCNAIATAMRSGSDGYRAGCKRARRACMKRC